MSTFFTGVAVTLVVVAIVFLLVKMFSKEEAAPELSPQEAAAQLTKEQKAEFVLKFENKKLTATFAQGDIEVVVDNMVITDVKAYGVQYKTIEAMLNGCELEKQDRYDVEQWSAELDLVRSERLKAKRYYRYEKTEHDGEVFLYEPCKIKIDTLSRLNQGLQARIAVDIVKKEDGALFIETIYTSTEDVVNGTSVYEFDMRDDDDKEAFKLLYENNSKYGAEVYELNVLRERLDKANNLIKKGRLTERDGKLIILPPSPKEIKAKLAAAAANNPTKDKAPVVEPVTPEEVAKEQVSKEFVSSVDAI